MEFDFVFFINLFFVFLKVNSYFLNKSFCSSFVNFFSNFFKKGEKKNKIFILFIRLEVNEMDCGCY